MARAAPRPAALRRLGQPLGPPGRRTATWPRSIGEILARTGLDPVHLRLEVTESVLVEESATATGTLEALSDLGVGLVLDDFGTGYSSLAYLNRFPFDALKIDRSFVDALGVEQERTAIVEAIIGMARALSLDVIAEGVENEAAAARAEPARLRLRPGPPLLAGAAGGEDLRPAQRRGAALFGDRCPAGSRC